METNNVNDYLMKKMIQKEAMKRISSDYPLNDELANEIQQRFGLGRSVGQQQHQMDSRND